MHLILGDMHLLNEASDKYSRIIPMIHEALTKLDLVDKIDTIDILGDVLDCEYVTFKRITYFSFIMEMLAEKFTDNITVLIGNHDKYFKNDQHDENIIRYIKFNGQIIDSPVVMNRILYIPHYYSKDNFPAGLLEEKDFDIILGHLGLEFINGVEELTLEATRKFFKKVPIISGHIHNIDLNYQTNSYFLGSMKSESWKEQAPMFSIALLDNNDYKFITLPYNKVHLIIDVNNEDGFREYLTTMFKEIYEVNTQYRLYDKNGDVIRSEMSNRYTTTMINMKLKIHDKNITKKNIDLIVEYAKHTISDPMFVNIPVKIIYQIESEDPNGSDLSVNSPIKVNKTDILEKRQIVYEFIERIKSGKILTSLGKNKKFTKSLDGIDEGEVDRFAEFLVTLGKANSFESLLKKIK